MGCGSSSRLYLANEAIRTNDTSAEAQELLARVDVSAKGSDNRIPFMQACRYGRTKMVLWMLQNDKKKKIKSDLLHAGVRENCAHETNVETIKTLMETGGADPNYQGPYGETALTMLAMKNDMTTKEVLTQRRMAAVYLVDHDAVLGLPNGEGLTAVQVACRDYNEKMALLLAEKGASVMEVQKYMRKSAENQKNWVAGSVLARYAFKYPKFVQGLRKQFLQMFDVDGNGELDRQELTHFIAAHVKMAFKAGLMPTAEFFDDGSLEVDQIETLLESRCKDMLKGYFSLDKDRDGTYSWEELLPIVKDFYINLWTGNRPADADEVDDVDYGAEEEKADATGTEDYGVGTMAEDYGAGTLAGANMGESSLLAPEDMALPEGWRAVEDPTSGQVYYYHTETHETTWDRPTL